MTLLNETHVRGANKEYTFKHRIKGTLRMFVFGATSEENAKRKAWKEVSKAYRELKRGVPA